MQQQQDPGRLVLDKPAPSPRLSEWVVGAYGPEHVKSVRYLPYLTFFYPSLRPPDRLATAARQTVVRPADTEQVAAILRKAYELDEPVFVRQGTGLLSIDTVLPVPPGAVVIDLRRLDRILPDVEAGYVEVGPAVTLGQTNEALAPLGFEYPVAVQNVQWGGLASINLSGHLVDAHSGKPGDFVLGLTVVLPNGDVLNTGTRAMRKVVGPDLTRLFVGGQALFGVITGLRLRLKPRPAARVFAWAAFEDIHGVADTVLAMYASGLPYPTVMELIDEAFVTTSGMTQRVPDGHLLMVATEGEDGPAAQQKINTLLDLARSHGAFSAKTLDDEADWDWLWKIRESPFRHLGDQEILLGEALDVALDRMHEGLDEMLTSLREIPEIHPGLRGYLVAHIGAGTLHPMYACPADWDYDRRVEVARSVRRRILEAKLRLGATVGEQGIFPQHARWFAAHYGQEAIEAVKRLKRAFDPKDLLNPGRLLPPAGISEDGVR